jgi:hypothetical protein
MTPSNELEPWRRFDRLGPALLTGLLIGAANYVMDLILVRLGTSASASILSSAAIGILGGASVYFYLTASRAKYNYENAKERMALIGDLNERIRQAMVAFAASALSDDRAARLRGIDQATDHIDGILTDFLKPTNGNAKQPVLRRLQTDSLETQRVREDR